MKLSLFTRSGYCVDSQWGFVREHKGLTGLLSSFPPGRRYIPVEVKIGSFHNFRGGQSAQPIYCLPQGTDPLRCSHQGGKYGTCR